MSASPKEREPIADIRCEIGDPCVYDGMCRIHRYEAELRSLRAKAKAWRCFHCGFETSDRAEARAHFGDGDDEAPLCVTWASLAKEDRAAEYQSLVRELDGERDENSQLRTRVEGLEYRVDGQRSEIKSFKPFRECDSIQQVFNVFDSMEGRALAAEAELRSLRKDRERLNWLEGRINSTDTPDVCFRNHTGEQTYISEETEWGRMTDVAAACTLREAIDAAMKEKP